MKDFVYISSIDSTNVWLSGKIDHISSEGFIVQTDYQLEGKGQQGNSWESSPYENLTFSMALFPKFLAPTEQFLISKCVSLAIVKTLNKIHPGFKIKWPNDIYYGDMKLGGILIETAIMGNAMNHAILGIGLNINQTQFEHAPNPTSLALLTHQKYKIEPLLCSIKDSIIHEYNRLKDGEIQELEQEYFDLLYRNNGTWTFKTPEKTFEASIETVLPDGQLHLRDIAGNSLSFWMKEVEFVI